MSGTKIGGQRAAATNKRKYGDDFYVIQGAKGGKNGTTGGFAHWKLTGQTEKIREAGKKGGRVSRRRKYDA